MLTPLEEAEQVGRALLACEAVRAVVLFGSVARDGEGKDLDILVVLDDLVGEIRRFNNEFGVNTENQSESKTARLERVLEIVGMPADQLPQTSLALDVFVVPRWWRMVYKSNPRYHGILHDARILGPDGWEPN